MIHAAEQRDLNVAGGEDLSISQAFHNLGAS